MNNRAKEFEVQMANSDLFNKDKTPLISENKTKIQKLLKEINKLISSNSSGSLPDNKLAALDRALGELDRLLAKTINVKNPEVVQELSTMS